jgi:2-acylglycerol O-acyltransferase 2
MFGISLPLVTNILPRRTNITVVVGKPLDFPKIEEPSKEDCDKYLSQYIKAVEDLYKENAPKYNIPKNKKPLEII